MWASDFRLFNLPLVWHLWLGQWVVLRLRGPGSIQSCTLGMSLGPLLLLRSGKLAGPDLLGEKELKLVWYFGLHPHLRRLIFAAAAMTPVSWAINQKQPSSDLTCQNISSRWSPSLLPPLMEALQMLVRKGFQQDYSLASLLAAPSSLGPNAYPIAWPDVCPPWHVSTVIYHEINTLPVTQARESSPFII